MGLRPGRSRFDGKYGVLIGSCEDSHFGSKSKYLIIISVNYQKWESSGANQTTVFAITSNVPDSRSPTRQSFGSSAPPIKSRTRTRAMVTRETCERAMESSLVLVTSDSRYHSRYSATMKTRRLRF